MTVTIRLASTIVLIGLQETNTIGYKDVNEAWAAGVLAVEVGPAAAVAGGEVRTVPPHLHEPWAERVAIMVMDCGLPHEEAARLAWAWLQTPDVVP